MLVGFLHLLLLKVSRLLSFPPQAAEKERNGSCVFFYDILRQNGERERTGGTMKGSFALCMYTCVRGR